MTEVVELTRYPIDTDEVTYGTTWSPTDLERITGTSRSGDFQRYTLAVLRLKDWILRDVATRRGLVLTAKLDKGSLRILQPSEAAEYNHTLFCQRVDQMRQSHRRQCGVDVAQLNDDERAKHDQALRMQGVYLASLGRAKKELTLEPVQRDLPKMVGS